MSSSHHQARQLPDRLPVLVLNNIVIFPLLAITIKTGNPQDTELLLKCREEAELVAIASEREPGSARPLKYDHIHPVGTACRITRINETGQNRVEAVLEGVCRISFLHFLPQSGKHPRAMIAGYHENGFSSDSITQMLMESSLSLLKNCCNAGQPLPESANDLLERIDSPGHLADLITLYLEPDLALQRRILALVNPRERLKLVHQMLYDRLKELERDSVAPGSPSPSMRFGHPAESSGEDNEIDELRKKISRLELDTTIHKTVFKELDRLERMNPASPDYHNILHYVEYVAELPWRDEESENLDLDQAEKILDQDHFGLEKVKERIIEHLAVRQLKQDMKSPIICLVGPPGVGKTSLGKSVARAMGRKFIRVSLGGVRDEAEIRGHRRTYLGAMPGKIIQEIKRAGSRNPVFMLDEIDKLGHDFRGDPASALLEVMDPEQNHAFVDHYLNLPFDLSRVFFIATANRSDSIPDPLLDRMEVINLSGYSEEEKKSIACRYLLDRQRENHGLEQERITFTDEALDCIIDSYTREAGVRNLEKMIGKIMRKCAREKVAGRPPLRTVTRRSLNDLLGPELHHKELAAVQGRIGIVTGLAWTPTGGEILFIEAALMESEKGENLTLTGSLGDVMKESAQTALSYLRSIAREHEIEPDFFGRHRIHIHIPSGAIPKDGPSAGLAIFLTLLSLASNRIADHKTAITGEISLSGRVLKVGGVKEKVLAARRAGIRKVVMPRENLRDLDDLPEQIRQELTFHGIETITEAIDLVLSAPTRTAPETGTNEPPKTAARPGETQIITPG